MKSRSILPACIEILLATAADMFAVGWALRVRYRRQSVRTRPRQPAVVQRAEFPRRAGYSTPLIDFQGTGESKGEAPGERVGVIGVSLGGAQLSRILARTEMQVDHLARYGRP